MKTAALATVAMLVPLAVLVHIDARSAPPPPCIDAETREAARVIMLDGITAGLKAHTTRLYDVWLKDPSEQPDRAAVGLRNGVAAYIRARRDIENWQPPACKGDKQ